MPKDREYTKSSNRNTAYTVNRLRHNVPKSAIYDTALSSEEIETLITRANEEINTIPAKVPLCGVRAAFCGIYKKLEAIAQGQGNLLEAAYNEGYSSVTIELRYNYFFRPDAVGGIDTRLFRFLAVYCDDISFYCVDDEMIISFHAEIK